MILLPISFMRKHDFFFIMGSPPRTNSFDPLVCKCIKLVSMHANARNSHFVSQRERVLGAKKVLTLRELSLES